MNNKNIISPRGRDFFLYRKKKRYAELMRINNHKNTKIKSLVDNNLIGRFSCLSVSKLANITSFYNGKAYYYVMNMDIDQLHIDKIYELDTTEHNGVEVKIPLSLFKAKDLDCLSFIENVYVECVDDDSNMYEIQEFNKRKIHTFNNFKTITYEYRHASDKTEILLGKIPYAVDYMGLWDYNDTWHRSWEKAMKSIYPCINIGDVDITPNRETLIYSDKTKDCLKAAYEKCILELTEQWNVKCSEEYDDFFDWATELTAWRRNELDLEGTNIEVSDQLPFNAKLAGHEDWDKIDPKEKKKLVQSLLNTSFDTLGTLVGGTMYKGRRDVTISAKRLIEEWVRDKYNRDRMVLVVPSQTGFSSKYFKDFLGHKYHGKNIIFMRRQKISSYDMRSYIRRIWGTTMITDTKYCHFVASLLKEYYRLVAGNSIYDDIMNSEEYRKYKKEHQDPRTYVARHTGKITFTFINTEWYRHERYNYTIDEMLNYLKKNCKNKRVVYSTLDSPFLAAFHKIAYPNLVILSAAKNNMKYLEEGLPEYIRPIEELYTPDNRVLIKFKTAQFLKVQKDVEFEYFAVMPKYVQKRFEAIKQYLVKYDINKQNNDYYDTDARTLLDIIPEDVYDMFTVAEFNELKPFMELSYKITHNLSLYGIGSNAGALMEYYLLMKAKKIRPCYQYYKQMRAQVNNILNSL